MYEISELKSKKLPNLQVIAKSIGVKRIAGLKKMDLIYQIIDFVSANPDTIKKALAASPLEAVPAQAEAVTSKAKPNFSKPRPVNAKEAVVKQKKEGVEVVAESLHKEKKASNPQKNRNENPNKPAQQGNPNQKQNGNPNQNSSQNPNHRKNNNSNQNICRTKS